MEDSCSTLLSSPAEFMGLTLAAGMTPSSARRATTLVDTMSTYCFPENMQFQLAIEADAWCLLSEESVMASCGTENVLDQTPAFHLHPRYFDSMSRSPSVTYPPMPQTLFDEVTDCEPGLVKNNMVKWDRWAGKSHARAVDSELYVPATLVSSLVRTEPITPHSHHRSSPILEVSSVSAPLCHRDEFKHSPSMIFENEACNISGNPPESSSKREGISPIEDHDCRNEPGLGTITAAKLYVCSIPGCRDKEGCPKRFMRQEHKKRHERTVHRKGPYVSDFTCWVICGGRKCGRVFTRRDNLSVHLSKTHGRKSRRQRNSYVATLDKSSAYHDEDWRGPFTADGFPVGHPRFSEIQ